jgi:hypothetical protein
MAKFKKTAAELEQELSEQIEAMRSSAMAYDAGKVWEAKRLASSLYILAFDGNGRTKSLLGMTGHKSGLKVISSVWHPPKEEGKTVSYAAAGSPLLVAKFSRATGGEYVPKLGDHPNFSELQSLPFSQWWEQKISSDDLPYKLTRKNVVFSVRTQDGGGHVDEAISDEDYWTFKHFGHTSFTFNDQSISIQVTGVNPDPGAKPLRNCVPATVRQIVWELDHSLKKAGL